MSVPVKSYSKAELAQMYGIRRETLMLWIRPFLTEMEVLGYRHFQKTLTPAMIKLIFDKLGEPYEPTQRSHRNPGAPV